MACTHACSAAQEHLACACVQLPPDADATYTHLPARPPAGGTFALYSLICRACNVRMHATDLGLSKMSEGREGQHLRHRLSTVVRRTHLPAHAPLHAGPWQRTRRCGAEHPGLKACMLGCA